MRSLPQQAAITERTPREILQALNQFLAKQGTVTRWAYRDRRNVEQLASYADILEKVCTLRWRAAIAANAKEQRRLESNREMFESAAEYNAPYEIHLATPQLLRRQAGA